MRAGTTVIVPDVQYGNHPSLKLTLATVKGHRKRDGYSSSADYDYDLVLDNGPHIHWSHVYDIPEGVQITQVILDKIARECPPENLPRIKHSERRCYVYQSLLRHRVYTLPLLLKDASCIHVIVDNDSVDFYLDAEHEMPVENLNNQSPRELLMKLLKQLGFKARRA